MISDATLGDVYIVLFYVWSQYIAAISKYKCSRIVQMAAMGRKGECLASGPEAETTFWVEKSVFRLKSRLFG
jgi:hypothetical protein